ncbi:MAG: DUF4160 domain-containing protein [bacterium]
MPKIYEYLGITFFFYSNEHEPIHVHAEYDNLESKAEFIIADGEIIEIRIQSIKGKRPLKSKQLDHFKEFIEVHAEDIVKKWIDYFIYHKDVAFERITKRIK